MITKQALGEAFSNICASKSFDERVLKATVYKSKKSCTSKKIIYVKKSLITAIVLLCFIATGVTAKEIVHKYILNKEKINEEIYKQSVELDYPVTVIQDNDNSCDNLKSIEDIEKKLGVNFVFNFQKYNYIIDKCDIKKDEKENIESVKVTITEFYDFSEDNKEIDEKFNENFTVEEYMYWNSKRKIITLSISFMTQSASKNTKEEFKNLEEVRGNTELNNTEFYIKSLNTYGFYFILPSERVALSKTAIFIHENILYELTANSQVTIEELLEIINQFKEKS